MQVFSNSDVEQLIEYVKRTLIEEQNISAALDYLEGELSILLDGRDYDHSVFDSVLNEEYSYENYHLKLLIRAFVTILFDSLEVDAVLDDMDFSN
ncbi:MULTISPECIES: hypothetical protein [Vibrio]|uniref:Uncharacterized protein n=1 Tax=Vibrio parahaemolyticus TaxID=670 RepID=A0A9Q3U9S9_VIBPH|nr:MULTISPECIES: hypothetical protein [Vibrio]EGQ8109712.1 hypothetical protein [Vibrio parahaemolyticus]EGQ8546833.1 hypothetical protein [Vibrio parahaemolyticus]EGQ9070631.1 hypothetical protein [Vibrio parahaemolyticus]EGQ9132864.1 hypothetical protein [Vibrio parahaemolyticus]EGR3388471.1 hypothetical protein [Vibrio parahaemolyticus]